jgi:protein SCO1/2
MIKGAGRWVSVLVIAAASVTAGARDKPLPAFERVMSLAAPRELADVTLMDQDGKPRKLSELAGKPTFVFFGLTNCPEVCPATLRKLALIRSKHAKELAGTRVVFISVDGERDSPAIVKDYLRAFSSDFVGLTAPSENVRQLALSLSAPFFKDPPKDGDYNVTHSARVFALDKHARLRAELYDASPDAVVGISNALLAEVGAR